MDELFNKYLEELTKDIKQDIEIYFYSPIKSIALFNFIFLAISFLIITLSVYFSLQVIGIPIVIFGFLFGNILYLVNIASPLYISSRYIISNGKIYIGSRYNGYSEGYELINGNMVSLTKIKKDLGLPTHKICSIIETKINEFNNVLKEEGKDKIFLITKIKNIRNSLNYELDDKVQEELKKLDIKDL